MTAMTDAEVICSWLEPNPGGLESVDFVQWHDAHYSQEQWEFTPRKLDLDALWEVEERLTDQEWGAYCQGLRIALYHPLWGMKYPGGMDRPLLHATAEQKIKALADVIRSGAAS